MLQWLFVIWTIVLQLQTEMHYAREVNTNGLNLSPAAEFLRGHPTSPTTSVIACWSLESIWGKYNIDLLHVEYRCSQGPMSQPLSAILPNLKPGNGPQPEESSSSACADLPLIIRDDAALVKDVEGLWTWALATFAASIEKLLEDSILWDTEALGDDFLDEPRLLSRLGSSARLRSLHIRDDVKVTKCDAIHEGLLRISAEVQTNQSQWHSVTYSFDTGKYVASEGVPVIPIDVAVGETSLGTIVFQITGDVAQFDAIRPLYNAIQTFRNSSSNSVPTSGECCPVILGSAIIPVTSLNIIGQCLGFMRLESFNPDPTCEIRGKRQFDFHLSKLLSTQKRLILSFSTLNPENTVYRLNGQVVDKPGQHNKSISSDSMLAKNSNRINSKSDGRLSLHSGPIEPAEIPSDNSPSATLVAEFDQAIINIQILPDGRCMDTRDPTIESCRVHCLEGNEVYAIATLIKVLHESTDVTPWKPILAFGGTIMAIMLIIFALWDDPESWSMFGFSTMFTQASLWPALFMCIVPCLDLYRYQQRSMAIRYASDGPIGRSTEKVRIIDNPTEAPMTDDPSSQVTMPFSSDIVNPGTVDIDDDIGLAHGLSMEPALETNTESDTCDSHWEADETDRPNGNLTSIFGGEPELTPSADAPGSTTSSSSSTGDAIHSKQGSETTTTTMAVVDLL